MSVEVYVYLWDGSDLVSTNLLQLYISIYDCAGRIVLYINIYNIYNVCGSLCLLMRWKWSCVHKSFTTLHFILRLCWSHSFVYKYIQYIQCLWKCMSIDEMEVMEVSTNLLQSKKFIFSYQNKQIILYLWWRVIIYSTIILWYKVDSK